MNLSDEQKIIVAGWLEQGLGIGEVQKRLASELNIHVTYMETRFLIGDLNLTPKNKEPEVEVKPEPADDAPDNMTDPAQDPEFMGSGVQVSMDQIVKPGALISGKVTFSDGQHAEWYVDSAGRLGLDAETPGYRPSQDDVMAFQVELQKLARRQGF